MNDLLKFALKKDHRPLNKWEHYFDIYDKHFSRFRSMSPTVLEIGVFKGGSLEMWRDYFTDGQIIGLDVKPEHQFKADRIDVIIGSQDDPKVIDELFERYPNIDIVIDDGSHRMSHMIESFELIYPRMSPNGVYMVEDTHACYIERYGGGLGKQGTFIEYAKNRIDDLHANFTPDVPENKIADSTESISFYDSIVVFERKPQGKRKPIKR